MAYIIIPFFAWVIAGSLKFVINFLRFGKEAKKLIGYGGFPSTHTTILASVIFLIGFKEGVCTPIFSLGLGILLITVIDAHGLRNKIGEQAKALNRLQTEVLFRERMGHTWFEILGGVLLGMAVAFFVYRIDVF